MKSQVTVPSNGSPGHKEPRCGLASGARRRNRLSRVAAARGPRGPRPGLEWRRGGAGRTRAAKDHAVGSPRCPRPPPSSRPRPPRPRSAPPPRPQHRLPAVAPAPRPSSPTTRDGRPCTHAGLRPARGLGRDRASPAAPAGPQGPEAAARVRLRPSVPPDTLGGRGRRYPGRLPPSGLHQRGPKGCGVTHFLDVTETFSSL